MPVTPPRMATQVPTHLDKGVSKVNPHFVVDLPYREPPDIGCGLNASCSPSRHYGRPSARSR